MPSSNDPAESTVEPPRPAAAWRALLPVMLVPALLFVGLYVRSIDYEFVWTDQGEIEVGLLILPPGEIATALRRPMLSRLAEIAPGASAPYYRPLQVVAASWIDSRFGREPRNFRILNLALGAATASLVALLAWLLLQNRGAALLGGAIYALHPANIENYVWIAGMSHALAAFWIAASLILATVHLEAANRSRALLCGCGSVLALLLALLSKENAAVTPLLLLALAISAAFARAGRAPEPDNESPSASSVAARSGETGASGVTLRRAAPLLGTQILVTAIFVFVWRPVVLGAVLAEASPLLGSWRVQILSGIGSWPDAMGWLLLPIQSTTSDVIRLIGSPVQPRFLMGVALAAGSLWLWWRWLREGRVIAALGLAWIWIAYAPTSGLVPLNHMRGERYLSLSLLGLAILAPALGVELYEAAETKGRKALCVLAAVVVVLGLGQRSWQRIPDWRSNATLFASDVERDPLYREGRHELAKAYVVAGDLRAARDSLDALFALGDRFRGHAGFLKTDDALLMFCQINLNLDDPAASLRFFEKLEPDREQIAQFPALSLCGAQSLHRTGDVSRAIDILEVLYDLDLSPLRSQAAIELAAIHVDEERTADAKAWLARVRETDVRDPGTRRRLAELRRAIERNDRRR